MTYKPIKSRKEREAPNVSAFPKMGEEIPHMLINVSGIRTPYTQVTAKQTMGRGKSPTGKMAVRGRSMIQEANGPRFHVSTTLYKQNAAEASTTLRNTTLVSPAVHREDGTGSAGTFWDKRKYANQGV